MTDLDAAIRAKLEIQDSGEYTAYDPRFVYDCEIVQTALFAVLELHKRSHFSDCTECRESGPGYEAEPAPYPCPTIRAVAEKLGIEL